MKTARQLRKERNLTLKQLSKATGLSIGLLSKVENGYRTTLETKQVLQQYYGEEIDFPLSEQEQIEELKQKVEELQIENKVLYDRLAMIKLIIDGEGDDTN